MMFNEDILFYAFRYALGRKTYAVHDVIDIINKNLDILSERFLMNVKEEILEAPSLGMDIDKKAWMDLYDIIVKKLNSM